VVVPMLMKRPDDIYRQLTGKDDDGPSLGACLAVIVCGLLFWTYVILEFILPLFAFLKPAGIE
jgi:hypothetical protein